MFLVRGLGYNTGAPARQLVLYDAPIFNLPSIPFFMQLQLLLESAKISCSLIDCPDNLEISGVSCDSRTLLPGMLFLALPGTQCDGREAIGAAVSQGARAVLYDPLALHAPLPLFFTPDLRLRVPCLAVPNLQQRQGTLAAIFYEHPTSALTVYAVTGTNGKTTVTSILAHLCACFKRRCAVLGTLGCGFPGDLVQTGLTTPGAVQLQHHLATLRDAGATDAALEASSHGLMQGRLNGCQLDVAIFTQLGHDHLDYHGSIESYAAAKELLFQMPGLKSAVFNCDDPYGLLWAERYAKKFPVMGFSLCAQAEASYPVLCLVRHEVLPDGFDITLALGLEVVSCRLPLLGLFNVANFLAAAAALCMQGHSLQAIAGASPCVQTVPGRMQLLRSEAQPLVVVDFAHTPDALQQALQAVRAHNKKGQIWCVFGCGGERDRSKRSLMTSAALHNSDHVIITSDNPRSEPFPHIIADMLKGHHEQDPDRLCVLEDRAQAIFSALTQAAADDTVVIAGKGHESTQIVFETVQPFCDASHVIRFFNDQGFP